ncbi:hypothetical protein GCM10020331_057050 [Ectobacillus funiculus]
MTTLKERDIIQQQFKERMDEDELLNCMRCGFCLPSCPTYIESGFKESHSPRGRIALMKAVVDGIIEPSEDVERTLELCLGCRACEPVCPSGVKYGHLLEEARDIINQSKKSIHCLYVQYAKQCFKSFFSLSKPYAYCNRPSWRISTIRFASYCPEDGVITASS